MRPAIQRGLFWRVYATVLASLVATAVLGAAIWHLVMGRPAPMPVGAPGAVIGALLPGRDAPAAEVAAAVRRVSAASGGRVALFGADGRPLAAAVAGRSVDPGAFDGRAPSLEGELRRLGRWRAALGDGRTLWVQVPPDRGPTMGEHLLLLLLAAAAVIGLAAYPIVARLTRRLERLRASLDAWGEGRLASRAQIDGRDEIAAVAVSFNAAADRVERLLAAHKSLLAHASHELRSPLARLRIGVEMMASTPDPALRPGLVRDMAELDALVEEILLASRLDQGSAPTERETVDLLAIAAEEAARGRAALVRTAGADASFEIEGSPRLLRRAIRNLVENAARHGAPPIEVELDRSGGRDDVVTVRVHDRGPGIPADERERVFEPFFRPQGWAEAAGGWGLGLSIVRQIAEAHGGVVACEPRPGGGASFGLVLPGRGGQLTGTARSDPRTSAFRVRSRPAKSYGLASSSNSAVSGPTESL